jgi:hypothetical protein
MVLGAHGVKVGACELVGQVEDHPAVTGTPATGA